MGLPQSNIDWTRYMEGLQGKANLDLNNTETKLSDSFISKMTPDYNAGIDLSAYNSSSSQFITPSAGYVFCFCNNYDLGTISINGAIFRLGNSAPDKLSREIVSILVDKGDSVYITFQIPSGVGSNPGNGFYPLKGVK